MQHKLKGFRRVEHLNTNQTVVYFDNGSLFQSYDSIIALNLNGKTYLGKNWDYSQTTGKYRNIYLGESKAETQKKIDSKEYKML